MCDFHPGDAVRVPRVEQRREDGDFLLFTQNFLFFYFYNLQGSIQEYLNLLIWFYSELTQFVDIVYVNIVLFFTYRANSWFSIVFLFTFIYEYLFIITEAVISQR